MSIAQDDFDSANGNDLSGIISEAGPAGALGAFTTAVSGVTSGSIVLDS